MRILHLVGSAENNFYANLSLLYARECLEATMSNSFYEFHIAYITPDSQWHFPPSLSQEDISAAKPLSLSQAIEYIIALKVDLVLPQMFCLSGMTQYRCLFDLLKIPYLGNTAKVMAITADKAMAKAIVKAAGVKVPPGELLRRGDTPTIQPPVVIKPTQSDNSLGVTLIKHSSEYDLALETAFKYSEEVLVEKFIEPGREVRCGIIVKDGELVGLPLEEYLVNNQDSPIRKYSDKLKQTEKGEITYGSAKNSQRTWIVDPLDPITESVQAMAKICHQALGCRYYSLFDFRIDPFGQPWFLEAGLYCSFSPKSVIPSMAKAMGIPVDKLLYIFIRENFER